jgi:putative membrane protein
MTFLTGMKMLIRRTLFAVMILLFIQSCTNNSTDRTISLDTQGSKFIKNAIESNLVAIKASQLAQSSHNSRVSNLASMIVTDYSKINVSLKDFAHEGGLKDSVVIDASYNQALNELAKKSGADIDRSYVQMTIKEQEKVLMSFIFATQDKNDSLRSFAKATLPKIHRHLDSARAISQSLK